MVGIYIAHATLDARIAKSNRIFAGLWHGKVKAEMNLFLKPVVDSLYEALDYVNYTFADITSHTCRYCRYSTDWSFTCCKMCTAVFQGGFASKKFSLQFCSV